MKALTVWEAYRTWYGILPGRGSTELIQQVVHPSSCAIKITLKLVPGCCPSTVLPSLKDISLNQDWQMDLPRVFSTTVCNVSSSDDIFFSFVGWEKLFPTYMETCNQIDVNDC